MKKNHILVIIPILLISFLNSTRNIDNDLENYINYFNFFTNNSFLEIFSSIDFLYLIKITEPTFYIFTYLLNKFTFGIPAFFIFIYTLIIYVNYIYGLKKIFDKNLINESDKLFFYIISILACINISETSHLLRQYFAGSFIPIFIYFVLGNRYLKTFFIGILIISIHNSMAIILLLIFLSFIFYNQIIKYKRFIYLFFLIPFVFFFNFYISKYLFSLEYNDEASKLLSISIYYDFFIIIVYLYFSFRFSMKFYNFINFFNLFLFFLIIFLTTITYSDTLFLRFYLNIEFFRIFFIIPIYFVIINNKIRNLLKFSFICFFLLIFILRIYVSPWHYFTFELFNA